MIRMEEREAVKEYFALLKVTGMEHMTIPARRVFRQMDRLKNELEMVSGDIGYVEKGLDAMTAETGGLCHVRQALSVAMEKAAAAWEEYDRAEALVLKGVWTAVDRCMAGHEGSMEKPLPIQAVEQKMEGMKRCLRDAFIAVDIGIGRAEEAERMFRRDGHYWDFDSFGMWADSDREPGLLDVMWPLCDLEQVIGQSYEAAHQTALCADTLRPKGRAKFEWDALKEGYFWNQEKAGRRERPKRTEPSAAAERAKEEKQGAAAAGEAANEKTETAAAGEAENKKPGAAVVGDTAKETAGSPDEKPSLRKRLLVAEGNSRRWFPAAPAKGKGGREGEMLG